MRSKTEISQNMKFRKMNSNDPKDSNKNNHFHNLATYKKYDSKLNINLPQLGKKKIEIIDF